MSLVDLGLRRVYAQCFEANTASWRLMEKLGMRRERHTRRESLHHSGQWLDGVMLCPPRRRVDPRAPEVGPPAPRSGGFCHLGV